MLQALSSTPATPVVRVPANVPMYIQRVLDLGAYGVIVPLVNTRAEAEAVVASVRYAPKGARSWGPVRGAIYGGADYFSKSSEELLTLVMIESAEGLDNAREILAVDGVDGCFVGPADLNISLGYSPEHPELAQGDRGGHRHHPRDGARGGQDRRRARLQPRRCETPHRAGLSLRHRHGGDPHDPRGCDAGPGRAQELTPFRFALSSASAADDSCSTCASVHWRGALSGRQRRNFVPCRKRPPLKWSYCTSTTSFGLERLPFAAALACSSGSVLRATVR